MASTNSHAAPRTAAEAQGSEGHLWFGEIFFATLNLVSQSPSCASPLPSADPVCVCVCAMSEKVDTKAVILQIAPHKME